MNYKELTDMLVSSIESNRGKFVPWWEDDFENCMYVYDMFSKDEIQNVNECIKGCSKEEILAPVSGMGLNLFHLLVWHGFYDAVKLLIEEGIDVNTQAVEGRGILKDVCIGATPFMLTCYRGNLSMAELLHEAGADTSLVDDTGRNAYHYLGSYIERLNRDYQCQKNSLDFRNKIAELIEADINQENKNGDTPLEALINDDDKNLSWALTKVYINKGAKKDKLNENGESLLIRAIKNSHITAAIELASDKELINKADNEGKTPLYYAVERSNFELCMMLVSKGADKDAKDNNGVSPKDKALESGYDELEKYFKTGRIDMSTLSRLTSNSFAGYSEENRDKITLALFMAGKLISEADTDDDDEMQQVLRIMYNALLQDEECQVLDICNKAGIDFVQPVYAGSGVTCVRDECLKENYGVKVIKKFVDLGVDMDEAVIKGRTPANIVASLEKRKASFGKKDDYQEKAVEFFSVESMEQLDDNGTSAIHYAAKNNNCEMLAAMIEKGADVNITEDEPADAGNTPLHIACARGNVDTVKLLIKSGADDTIRNVKGITPAHLAVTERRFGGDMKDDERTAILEALNNVDVPTNDGRTPLMQAQYLNLNACLSATQALIDKGVDVNHADNDGNTALILNTKNQSYKGTVKELIKAGADVNAVDKAGNSALFYALKYGDQESSRFMLKKGADYNHANNDGVTPMQVAVEKGYDAILELMM